MNRIECAEIKKKLGYIFIFTLASCMALIMAAGIHFLYNLQAGHGPTVTGVTLKLVVIFLSISAVMACNALKKHAFAALEDINDDLNKSESSRIDSKRKNETKTRFLAKMSHEIRTPMNVILGLTELALQNEQMPYKTKQTFLQIFRSSKLLLDIINDILDYSEVELGKIKIIKAPYDLYSLLVSCLKLNMIYLGEKHVKFEVNVSKEQPIKLFGDSLRIQQVLSNLLSNAFKYTENGSVKLDIAFAHQCEDELEIMFTVTDTGLGMSQDQLDMLQQNEYVRFVSDSKNNIEGTGLGISIANQLATLQGGSITVNSTLGQGSQFVFSIKQKILSKEKLGIFKVKRLKVLDCEVENLDESELISYQEYKKCAVLVVDDIASNLAVMKEMLSMYKIEARTANCGMDAIGLVERQEYDMIFMDYMMPGMDGIEAMHRIRDTGYSKPIIVLTADVTNESKTFFMNSGFDGFLSKPIQLHHLDSCLKQYIPQKDKPVQDGTGKTCPSKSTISSFLTDVNHGTETVSKLTNELKNNGQAFEKKAIEAYRIAVHGLKSACANVGYSTLSGLAGELEQAAKEGDNEVILNKTPFFVSGLKKAASELEAGMDGFSEGTDADPAHLAALFDALAAECKAYEIGKAKQTMKTIKANASSSETKRYLEEVRQLFLHSEIEKIAEKSTEFAEKLRNGFKK